MGLKESLIELAETDGVSGREEHVRDIVLRELKQYVDQVFVTRLGSVVGLRHADGKSTRRGTGGSLETPKLMLEAHMDEIGLVVTSFDHGFVHFTQIGGYDVRVLPSQNVTIHGQEDLPGVIGSRPPHVLRDEERSKVTPMRDLFIDVGLTEARVRELVTVGDVVTLDRKVTALMNGNLAGKSFDDRAAVAVVIDTMRRIAGSPLKWDVYAVANVQEEDGAWYVGATTSAHKIRPDVALVLDVSHADQPGVGDVNVVPLDKGPGIAMGPNIHPLVHARLLQIARELELPHRITSYAGPTGTDAWAIQVVADGIPTGLVDLPLRYMHTSVETCSVEDLIRASRLSASFASSLDEEFSSAVKGQPTIETGRAIQSAKRTRRKNKR